MPTLARAYAVAESLAFGRRAQGLRHGPVRARWSADGSQFWYSTTQADGVRHVLVNAEQGEKQPLFDHALLAGALAASSGAPCDPAALPLTDVRLEPDGDIRFEACGGRWSWSDSTAELVRLGDAFTPSECVAPDGCIAVSLDGPNLRLRSTGEAAHRPLTEDGEPEYAWGGFLDFISQMAIRRAPSPIRPLALWSPDSTRFAVVRTDLRRVGTTHLLQSVHEEGVRPRLHSYRYPLPGDPELARCELWFFDRQGLEQ